MPIPDISDTKPMLFLMELEDRLRESGLKVDADYDQDPSCDGHGEITIYSPDGSVKINLNTKQVENALTDEEWLANMGEHSHAWLKEELGAAGIEIVDRLFGHPIGRVNGNNINLGLAQSPEGKQYYYVPKGDYDRLTGKSLPTEDE